MPYAIYTGVKCFYTMHYIVFWGGKYCLYYTLSSIFGEWILFVLYTRQNLREVDIIYNMNYAVFLWVKYLYTMYYVELSGDKPFFIWTSQHFQGYILFILCTTHYFRGVNTFILFTTQYIRGVNTIFLHYAVFLRRKHYLYNAQRSVFWASILLIPWTTQYFHG